jgi:phosphoribosylanthranilate isomerase
MGRLWINNQSTPKIKICGIKTLETAYEAYILGIYALGFHLWLNKFSKQQLENYEEIISSIPKEISSVLVSDIIEPKIILPIFKQIPFDTFQIQGNLSIQSLSQIVDPIRRLNSNIKIVKLPIAAELRGIS